MTVAAARARGDAIFCLRHPVTLESGARMRIDLPERSVAMEAPEPWLALLLEGDRSGSSFAQLAAQAQARWGGSDFMALVDELVDHGLACALPRDAGRPLLEFFQESVGSRRAIARASLRWPGGECTEGWGRDATPNRAGDRALGEAVERHAFRHPAGDWRVARGADIDNREAELAFVPHLPAQYARPGVALSPFRLSDERCWLPTTCLATGAERWIPAEAIHPGDALPMPRERRCVDATTSGFACAATLDAAIEHAVHELVERDAFMRHWLAQEGGLAVRRDGLPAEVDAAARELESAGCDVHLQRLTRGVAPAWLAIVRHPGLGFTTAGAASGADPADALDRALAEAHALALARLASGDAPDAPALDPADARTPADHALVHGQRRHDGRAAGLMRCHGAAAFAALARDAGFGPARAILAQRGLPASLIDFSEGSRAFDSAGRALRTVRVVVPALAPLTFGGATLPLAFGPAAPGAEFPHPLA